MKRDWKDALAHDTGVVCPHGQLLTDVAALAEVDCRELVYERWKHEYFYVRPPMISRFDSIGKACVGGMSAVPSGTPCNIL